MTFSDSSEVVKYIGGIFEQAYLDPELEQKLKANDLVLQFNFTDPDTVIVIDFAAGEITQAPAADPGVTMTMSADTGNAYWQGKVNLPLAMAKSKIKVEGNVAKMLKVAPLSKKLFPQYVETLKADGRDDLVV